MCAFIGGVRGFIYRCALDIAGVGAPFFAELALADTADACGAERTTTAELPAAWLLYGAAALGLCAVLPAPGGPSTKERD